MIQHSLKMAKLGLCGLVWDIGNPKLHRIGPGLYGLYGYLNACCVSSGLHEMTKAKKKVAAKPHNSLFLFCNMNRFGMAAADKKWFYKLASSTLSYAVAVTKSLL